MVRTTLSRSLTLLSALCLSSWLPGCEADPPSQEADATETLQGQELVTCWTSPDPFSTGVTNVRCRLLTDGPLVVNEANINATTSSSGIAWRLTPEEPERVVYSSNMIRDLKLSMELVIDASGVVGLESFRHKEEIKLEKATEYPADAPAIVRAPFATWRLALIGEEASLTSAALAAYKIKLGGNEVDVKPELPDVPLGEKVVVYLPVQTKQAIDGKGSFGVDGAEEERAFSVKGTGAYLVRKDGLEYRWAPDGELPVALQCWVDEAEALACQPSDPGGMAIQQLDIKVSLADTTTRSWLALIDYESKKTILIDNESGDLKEIEGTSPALALGTLGDGAFPLVLDATIAVGGAHGAVRTGADGKLVGFDDLDPLVSSPIVGHIELASPNEAPPEAPLAITLPFQVWEVVLEAAPTAPTVLLELDGYEVRLGTAWNGKEMGSAVSIAGQLPHVSTSGPGAIASQTFYLPVEPGRAEPIEGSMKFSSDGLRFAIPGPGRYVLSETGLTSAP